MEQLIGYAMGKIPTDQYSTTPLFLKATAGMRLLPQEDQDAILAVIRELFQKSPFRFDADSWASVISGQDEGVFGWLTVNHLTDKLEAGVPFNTFGALDLGGASTQITFVPASTPAQDGYELSLSKMSYELFSKSYLSYGSDQAKYGYNASLVSLNPGSTLLPDPCLNLGFDLGTANFTSADGNTTYSLVGISK